MSHPALQASPSFPTTVGRILHSYACSGLSHGSRLLQPSLSRCIFYPFIWQAGFTGSVSQKQNLLCLPHPFPKSLLQREFQSPSAEIFTKEGRKEQDIR